ncbi:hypothetical protein GG681_02280 [Epibacterium sp. SM1969]|uniref:Uncharacterized protein n=1 Tax=Tritonibacter aquimaris TaxID=2663379 RepID=A0A844AK00_9RHOB|nr:hypothetical protein [Tritonibacter aquimaris]MQY41455.1 hypothetical protein [Tritonibacter aquimaris]
MDGTDRNNRSIPHKHMRGAITLELTISQLDTGYMPPERAQEVGQLGYMQWLGVQPGAANYLTLAQQALDKARPFAENSPAVAVFCDLLKASLKRPLKPLVLALPVKQRRGGARARRAAL